MNYKKLILVGFISAFVALLTSVLGVAGTIIGSVISSVLYNMLSEALEEPMSKASLNANFEWDIAYVFPLVVIAFIQLLFIFALLSEAGFLPNGFLEFYLSIQNITENNLFRILGLALIIMSVYPIVLKRENVKQIHGIILGVIGLVFLARGFLDMESVIVDIYDGIFTYFDFQISVISFIFLLIVIVRILISAYNSKKESGTGKSNNEKATARRVYPSESHDDFDYFEKGQKSHNVNHRHMNKPRHDAVRENNDVRFKSHIGSSNTDSTINRSSKNIHFESNDLLDDYKK